ncbi:LacI family transcriptional regulator [Isoptericola sp. 4D.3]|uniref:LacI family transcriptional regulator n=1 Tax=Isoptericola peretonis TaxID=2918523 RepID=A0ABT0J541_9MICO|nr:LacI family transcriptional regulator [Isoptericola sp. 4D.3]
MVTMSDVAREAGVSMMTVSNVLTGRKRVGEPTRDRVLAAVESLGYEVNLTARHLRAGRTDTVALIVPSFHDYFGEVADRIAPLIEAGGRHLVVERTSADARSEMESLSLPRLQMYDGVFLSVAGLHADELDRVPSSAPIVLLGEREVPGRFDHVRLANVEGARLATAHMLERGARRVLALGGAVGSSAGMESDRQTGWAQAHRAAGLAPGERLVVPVPDFTSEAAFHAVVRLLDDGVPFDGVFAVNDTVAFGAVAALTERGVHLPDEVQLVGFDNLGVSRFVPPGITSVDPGYDAVAATAVRLLEQRMTGSDAPREHVTIPVQLVERGSTRRLR